MADTCVSCQRPPSWHLRRYGDNETALACPIHLHRACKSLQRSWEDTTVSVKRYVPTRRRVRTAQLVGEVL